VGGIRIADLILSRFPALPDNRTVAVRGDFLPSLEFAALLATGAGTLPVGGTGGRSPPGRRRRVVRGEAAGGVLRHFERETTSPGVVQLPAARLRPG
ncbi:hypothetical protein, partial [Victivallis vadensis]|uniref:hypothetical protein n=1 Tax=Victivallis vadensis TaxID=172901 RepID=UPI003AF576C4